MRDYCYPCFTDEEHGEVRHSIHTAKAAEQDLEPGGSRASACSAPHSASTNPTWWGQNAGAPLDSRSGGGAEVLRGAWTYWEDFTRTGRGRRRALPAGRQASGHLVPKMHPAKRGGRNG